MAVPSLLISLIFGLCDLGLKLGIFDVTNLLIKFCYKLECSNLLDAVLPNCVGDANYLKLLVSPTAAVDVLFKVCDNRRSVCLLNFGNSFTIDEPYY